MLIVPLRPIVGDAEHLAIGSRRIAPPPAPCGHMVSVHLVVVVDSRHICVVADGAQRAVGIGSSPSPPAFPAFHQMIGAVDLEINEARRGSANPQVLVYRSSIDKYA